MISARPSTGRASAARGSSTTSESVSKRMVGLRLRSYSANRDRPGGEGNPGGVHRVGERLWRVWSQKRLGSEAERVEDEGDLQRMARAEASAELRRAPGEFVHVGGAGRSSRGRRPGEWRGCASTSRSGLPRAGRRRWRPDAPRGRRSSPRPDSP